MWGARSRYAPTTTGIGHLPLSGNRPGSPLRRDSIGFLYPQPGGHRHLHGLDGGSSPAGQGTVPGVEGLEAIAGQLPFPVLG